MQFEIPKERPSIIKVIGVGGGGSNAVNHMYKLGIKGVEFLVCNTDHQALDNSPVPSKIALGPSITEGRGAGAIPEVGKNAAIENLDELKEILSGSTKMVFITAGMGGGTGTGAAPIIAGIAKEMGILTVGIVTIPFSFEGKKRKLIAEEGIEELRKNVDTLLVICNDKLREIHGNLNITEAFSNADDILSIAAKSIAEIITTDLHLNVDFADVQTVMKNSGVAIMGSATAEGTDRAAKAVSSALDSPLLNDNKIEGARYILLNITSGNLEATMDEVGEINDYIQEQAGNSADIIMGLGLDEKLDDNIGVTIIATGFVTNDQLDGVIDKEEDKLVFNINGDLMKHSDQLDSEDKIAEPNTEVTNIEVEEADQVTDESDIKLVSKPSDTNSPENTDTIQSELIEPLNDDDIESTDTVDTKVIHYLDDNMDEKKPDTSDSPNSSLNSSKNELNDSHISDEAEELTKEEESKEVVFEFNVNTESDQESKVENDSQKYEPLPPIIRNEEEDEKAEDPDDYMDSQLEKTRERIQKLRELSYNYKMRNSDDISRFEKEPAYKRRKVELDDQPPASSDNVSRYTVSNDKDNKPEIKPNNSFLHDRVD